MKPKNNQQNFKKCICVACPLYADCNKNGQEALFCAKGKSKCSMDTKKMCICGNCPVYAQNDLSGGYFCIA